MIFGFLGAGCATASFSPPQQFAQVPVDDSTGVTGPLRWVLHAGDEWLRVRVSNSGESPVAVSWDGAQLLTPDGVAHRLVEASRFRDFQTMHDLAAAAEVMLPLSAAQEGMLRSRRLANALKHRAPAGLGLSEPARVGPGETAERILYPAEHITVDASGDVIIEPLLAEHAFVDENPLRLLLTLVVPVRVDGRSTTIATTAHAYDGIPW